MDLDEILNLDIQALKNKYLPKEDENSENSEKISEIQFGHRQNLNIIPRNLRTETIDFLERTYHKDGKFPSIQSIDRHIHLSRIRNGPQTKVEWETYLTSPEFEEILINRGLPTYDSKTNRIDLNFSLAVTLVCDISDKRSLAAKLKDAGLTTRQWSGFLKRRSHYEFFESRLNRVWNDEVEQKAKLALMRSVEAGDLTAVKYFHEYTDRYRPQDTQILNLQIIITGLLEILAKHLNKQQLTAVAAEFEATGILSPPVGNSRAIDTTGT